MGILGAALATNEAAPADSAAVTNQTVISMNSTNSLEVKLEKIMEDDDAAHAEVDGWIRENQKFAAHGAAIPDEELNQRILKRLGAVREAYESFIKQHPDYAPARLAFASYLDGIGEETAQAEQLEKARELDPKNPAAWNQLANYYGHNGSVSNAFAYYAKASEIDPQEPVYYWNLATTVYLFRRDATNFYKINESQVFDKSLALYAKALSLDPTNFVLATDLAESYYGIRPLRTNDSLQSWTNALHVAHSEVEREGVYIHLARFKTMFGRYEEARNQLAAVTNDVYADLKARLLRNIDRRENAATNAVWETTSTNVLSDEQTAPALPNAQ